MDSRITVEVPDSERGLVLAQRLGDGAEVVRNESGTWQVTLEQASSVSALIEALFAIERWLRDEQVRETRVHFDGQTHRMVCP